MKKINQIVCILSEILSIGLFVLALLYTNYNMLVISLGLLLLSNILYAIRNLRKRIFFLMFNISFGTLLVGKKLIEVVTNNVNNIFLLDIEINTIILLFLSLATLKIGMQISEKIKVNKTEKKPSNTISKMKLESIKNVSKKIFYLTYIVLILITLEKVVYVYQNGYLAMYKDTFNSIFPTIVKKIALSNVLVLYIFLGTYPKKSECKMVMILYQLYLVLSIFTGVRGEFVVSEIIIIMYYVIRNNENVEVWISPKMKLVFPIICVIAIIGLGSYNVLRNDKNANIDLSKQFKQFFIDQGGSIDGILYAQYYKNDIASLNQNYTFGPLINSIEKGIFGKLFSNTTIKEDPESTALHGKNLGATLSYFVLGNRYLNGEGTGVQYISELYVDYGYVGVIIYNLLIGYLMGRITMSIESRKYTNPYLFAVSFLILGDMVYIPRNFALSWITNLTSIGYIMVIFVIYLISNYKYNKEIKYQGDKKDYVEYNVDY